MAGTVIEYLKKYGDIPFCEKPLNDVDSLALCQLSYLKFDGMVLSLIHISEQLLHIRPFGDLLQRHRRTVVTYITDHSVELQIRKLA